MEKKFQLRKGWCASAAEHLETIPTQQLLKMRIWGYQAADSYYHGWTDDSQLGSYWIKPLTGIGPWYPQKITQEMLYAELAKRPHIPNKNESRGLRLKKLREMGRKTPKAKARMKFKR